VHFRKCRTYKAGTFAHASRATASFVVSAGRPSSVAAGRASHAQALARPTLLHGRASSARDAFSHGFISIMVPHKTRRHRWQKCWADIRAHHLIFRQIRGAELSREGAVPLPGASIVRLESLLASDLARWLASHGISGLELRPPESRSPIIFCVEARDSRDRWEAALTAESQLAGVGRLLVRCGERRGKWEPRWCRIDPDERELLCYAKPLDYPLGHEPECRIELDTAVMEPLGEEEVAEGSRRCDNVARTNAQQLQTPFAPGFKLATNKDADESDDRRPGSQSTTHFLVAAPGEPRQWFRTLQTLCVKSALTNSFGQELEEDGAGQMLEPRMTSTFEREESPFSRFERARPSIALARGRRREAAPLLPFSFPADECSSSPSPAASGAVASDIPARNTASAQRASSSSSSDSEADSAADSDEDPPKRGVENISTAVESDIEDGPPDEPAALANLRNLARTLRLEARALEEELQAEEYAARTMLAFFDEHALPGTGLATLQIFLSQVAGFAREFGAAATKVLEEKERRERRERPKAGASAPAKASMRLGGRGRRPTWLAGVEDMEAAAAGNPQVEETGSAGAEVSSLAALD